MTIKRSDGFSKFRAVGSLLMCGALALACVGASGGCGTALHQAALSSGTIAASLKTAAQVNHDDTLESSSEKVFVANCIIQTAVANDNFAATLKSVEASGGKISAAQITASFSALVTQVDQLQQQGALHLKSPQAQANFQVAISSIRAALSAIQGEIGTTVSSRAVGGGVAILSAGIVFTPAEIEELIALATTAASALLPKLLALRGETDTEILTEAEADDDAAIAEAEADGGSAPAGDPPAPIEEPGPVEAEPDPAAAGTEETEEQKQ